MNIKDFFNPGKMKEHKKRLEDYKRQEKIEEKEGEEQMQKILEDWKKEKFMEEMTMTLKERRSRDQKNKEQEAERAERFYKRLLGRSKGP